MAKVKKYIFKGTTFSFKLLKINYKNKQNVAYKLYSTQQLVFDLSVTQVYKATSKLIHRLQTTYHAALFIGTQDNNKMQGSPEKIKL